MNKKSNYVIFTIILLCIPFYHVNAAECTSENLALLKKWATNINYDYNYIEKDNQVYFDIRFTNLNSNITLRDKYHNKTYSNYNSSELIISGFPDGNTYGFEIIASDAEQTNVYYLTQLVDGKLVTLPVEGTETNVSCSGTSLTTVSVTVPSYNQFYNSEICKKYSTNKLCSKWYKHDLSYEDFEKEIIKSEQEDQEEKKEAEIDKTLLEKIIELYKNRPIVMFGGTLAIVGILIFAIITIKKHNESGFEGW